MACVFRRNRLEVAGVLCRGRDGQRAWQCNGVSCAKQRATSAVMSAILVDYIISAAELTGLDPRRVVRGYLDPSLIISNFALSIARCLYLTTIDAVSIRWDSGTNLRAQDKSQYWGVYNCVILIPRARDLEV